jgi:hypothetical protein
MNRTSPLSFVQAVHEWHVLSLDAFRKVRKGIWTQPEHSAYTKQVYVIDLVRRAVLNIPAHKASLMTNVEKEDWMRVQSSETMPQYIAHLHLLDSHIPQRTSKKRRLLKEDGDPNGQV